MPTTPKFGLDLEGEYFFFLLCTIFMVFLYTCKALVSAAQLSGAQSARSLCLSGSGAQKLIKERDCKLALIFALKMELSSLSWFTRQIKTTWIPESKLRVLT